MEFTNPGQNWKNMFKQKKRKEKSTFLYPFQFSTSALVSSSLHYY